MQERQKLRSRSILGTPRLLLERWGKEREALILSLAVREEGVTRLDLIGLGMPPSSVDQWLKRMLSKNLLVCTEEKRERNNLDSSRLKSVRVYRA